MLTVKSAKNVLKYVFPEEKSLFLAIICPAIDGAHLKTLRWPSRMNRGVE